MSDHVRISRQDGVLHLAIDRPAKKNALTGAMYDAMVEAIHAADADAGTAAIVFSGAPGVFTAGNDIGDFLQSAGSIETVPAFRFIRTIAACTTPLIAAVDGIAIGIGTTMILHCDLVYATPSSTFRMPFVELALVPEAASSLLLPQRAGMAKASEFLLLGEAFDAAEAHRLGLVNALVAPDALAAHVQAKAQKLGTLPREALAATRRLLRGDTAAVLERIALEGVVFGKQIASKEARDTFLKFMTKAKG